MTLFEEILFNVGCGLVAALLFLFIALSLLRPKVQIADCISVDFEEGIEVWRFKFINKSLFSAFDATVELYQHTEQPAAPRGKDIIPMKIPLATEKFSIIQRFVPHSFARNYAHHCIQVKTLTNLETILKERAKSLQLRITLRHGLTGLSANFVKDYNTERTIKRGSFEFGNKFNIL
ncbi:MAG: hypothetical protein EOP48_26525 [Sphingobacteriales bacterium]|nr:MAG: hypothetical protein EOP48_26525 [Sphingobacteriales bacterium]